MKHRDPDDAAIGDDPLHVDMMCLDEEWRQHPARFGAAARKLADAKHRANEAKTEVDLRAAELARAIRATPERYGVSKITEALVETTVTVQPEYQRAVAAYNHARHAQDVCQALVDALSHKKAALENAVVLWCRDYSSPPKIDPKHGKEARRKAQEMDEGDRWSRVRGTSQD